MINFSADLNPEQLAVVQNGDGPCLVLAGAGSGKTRTITYRVAHLLEQGIKPEEILLVTFTNKAAGEMKRRVQELYSRNQENKKTKNQSEAANVLPWSGTFHHIGYRLLRMYAGLLGFKNNFTVLDTDDSESIIKLCIKEVKNDASTKRFPSAAAVHKVISFSRNAERPIAEVLSERFEQWADFESELLTVSRLYAEKKQAANAMDFDDLLTNTLALAQNPQVQKKYATQFRYVLVDEYQDTNKIQAAIIRALASIHKNILVVGDDAQSIYSFRAADIANILQFEKQYPGAKIFKLQINYRSTEEILQVANSVIANNSAQYKKELRTTTRGVLPIVQPQIDGASEAADVANRIEKLLKEGLPAAEIAVLFRAAFHSQALEVELVSRGLDYDYRGGVRFFERAHIKDILGYLRVMNNLADTAAWLRVLMHEEGIGPAAAERVIEVVKTATDIDVVESAGRAVLTGRALGGWENFLSIWNALVNSPDRAPSALVLALLKTPYREYLEAEYVDAKDRLQDLAQLAEFAKRFENLEEFLAAATLQESFRAIEDGLQTSGFSNERGPKSEDRSPKSKIILSTIHQAKGLEWGAVFIINLSAGGFPNERASRTEGGLEEERRLFYVAVTRAKKFLYLTYPMASLRQGYGGQAGGSFGDFLSGPSIFLNEINPEFVEDHSLLLKGSTVFNGREVEYVSEDEPFPSSPPKIKPGSFLRSLEDL